MHEGEVEGDVRALPPLLLQRFSWPTWSAGRPPGPHNTAIRPPVELELDAQGNRNLNRYKNCLRGMDKPIVATPEAIMSNRPMETSTAGKLLMTASGKQL